MSNIVLSAQSSSNEIKAYFNSVLTLTKTGEKFPVDLDDVWTLCYNQKIGAIRFLADSGQFYEGEDYILLCQKAKQTEVGSGGHNRQVYMLSVPCMEYLIARKNRGEKISLRYAEISLRKVIVNSYTLMAWVVF